MLVAHAPSAHIVHRRVVRKLELWSFSPPFSLGTFMGRQKKPEWDLPEEMRVVFECSPNLEPCNKFRSSDMYRFADQLKDDKCQQCIDFFVQADKELKTIRHKNAPDLVQSYNCSLN